MAQPLEAHLEKELLRILRDEAKNAAPTDDGDTFKSVCDAVVDDYARPLFGNSGTDLRRRVQRRRDYLLRRPHKLEAAVSECLTSPQPKPPSSCGKSDLTPLSPSNR